MADKAGEEERLEVLTKKAAHAHSFMKDTRTIRMTMTYVGFTEEESKNRTIEQRVRRLCNKLYATPPSAINGPESGSVAVSDLSSPASLLLSSSSSCRLSLQYRTSQQSSLTCTE